MPVAEIKSFEQFKTVIDGDKPVVVDFWASWCGPCRVISPYLDILSDESEHAGVEFYKVNIDEVPEVAQELNISSIPTFITFKGGNKGKTLVGARRQDLKDLVVEASKV